jgi:PST family polysaccharide transporter
MLETQHDWKRFRLLAGIGTLLGVTGGMIVAFLGGGVWALVVQVPLFGVPAAIDLFWHAKWRPDWSWTWARYREAAMFGANRMGAAAVYRGRQTIEQTVLAGSYSFAALGVFTRTIGLATLIAGRIGSIAMMSVYPVVTRAEERSERFQRIAGLVLRGVCWTTIPAALLLALCADQVVALLYGPKWVAVVPLLPLAAAVVALSGIASTTSSLLMANNDARSALRIDIVAAVFAVALAVWLVPTGIETYLAALVAHGFVVLLITLSVLARKRGIATAALLQAFLPAMIAASGAAVAVEGFRSLVTPLELVGLRLLAEAAVFASIYLLILRLGFSGALREILDVAPGGRRLAASILLSEENS